MINGYNIVYCPNHKRVIGNSGCVYEHILIAEHKLGRELNNQEVVHHVDENRNNNSPDNIIVFKTKEDHTRYHRTRRLVLDGDVYISPKNICQDCGKIIDNHSRVLRCVGCSLKYKRRNWPTKEQLEQDIKELKTNVAISRKYNISDRMVGKIRKTMGL